MSKKKCLARFICAVQADRIYHLEQSGALVKIKMFIGSVLCLFLDTAFPLTLIVVFGIVGILILIMLIVVSQQHR